MLHCFNHLEQSEPIRGANDIAREEYQEDQQDETTADSSTRAAPAESESVLQKVKQPIEQGKLDQGLYAAWPLLHMYLQT